MGCHRPKKKYFVALPHIRTDEPAGCLPHNYLLEYISSDALAFRNEKQKKLFGVEKLLPLHAPSATADNLP